MALAPRQVTNEGADAGNAPTPTLALPNIAIISTLSIDNSVETSREKSFVTASLNIPALPKDLRNATYIYEINKSFEPNPEAKTPLFTLSTKSIEIELQSTEVATSTRFAVDFDLPPKDQRQFWFDATLKLTQKGEITTAIDESTSTSTTDRDKPTKTGSNGEDDGPKDYDGSTLGGVAVGCFLAGILLASLAAWLLVRYRRRSKSITPGTEAQQSAEKPLVAGGFSKSQDDSKLDHFLLDAVADGEIELELQALASLIEQHVESHYQLDVQPDATSLSKSLWQLGFPESERDQIIAAMSMSSTTRRAGVQHVISKTIFQSIDFHTASRVSMLPPPISGFLQSMPQIHNSAGSAALSQWRRLSAFLLHPNPGDRSALEVREPDVDPQALALADHLNAFLRMFVAPSDSASRAQAKHLQAVIVECTKFGYMLFSQPRDWYFVFEKDGSDSLVLCPGLDKLQVDGGQKLQRVIEPTLAPTRSRRSVRKAR